MTKKAVFRLILATFAVTLFVNSSQAQEYASDPTFLNDEPQVARVQVVEIDMRDAQSCFTLNKWMEAASSPGHANRPIPCASHSAFKQSSQPTASVVLIDGIETSAANRIDGKMIVANEKNNSGELLKWAPAKSNVAGLFWTEPKKESTVGGTNLPVGQEPINPLVREAAPLQERMLPIVGTVVGEYFFQLEKQIRLSQGETFGSRTADSFAMVILNPAGALSDAINQAAGSKVLHNAKSNFTMRQYDETTGRKSNSLGIQVTFQFTN